MSAANTLVVLDFETTGLSPDYGDRAIEIAAVRIEDGEITDKFQSLMNPGFAVNAFIEDYTGISNEMLGKAPPCAEVMSQFVDFIGDDNLVAHNASFDKRFLESELSQISRHYVGEFSCSLLLSRRVFQQAPNHKLATLVNYINIGSDGSFHRALYDTEMTAKLWLAMLEDMSNRYNIKAIPFTLVQKLNSLSKKSVPGYLQKYSSK